MSIFKNIVAAGLSVAILATPMVSSFRTNADAETPETTISETTEISGTTAESSTTEASETTTEPSETTTEQTTATVSAPVQTASDADAYIDEVSELSDSYRLIVSADTDTSALTGAAGVAYDGSCILTFTSEADYNAAIAYFDANAISYATDGEVSLCGDGSEDVPTGTVSDNAAVKIAIIDTGSNVANESVSVLGDSLTDGNGHGTAMANYVLAQTDNAYILSVKAIGDNGKGSVTDVYAGVQYAIDADCDVILLAMSIPDSGNYDTFKSLIGQAEADGITVIASAGNNSADASAYLPAGIDGVTTVGALNPDGTKLGISNYGSCVDYYVPAGSTSEAAATFAGKFIAGNIADVATGYAESTPAVTAAPTPTPTSDQDTWTEDDGTTCSIDFNSEVFTVNQTVEVGSTGSVTITSDDLKSYNSNEITAAATGIKNELDSITWISDVKVAAPTGVGKHYTITFQLAATENGTGSITNASANYLRTLSNRDSKTFTPSGISITLNWNSIASDFNQKHIERLSGEQWTVVTDSAGWFVRATSSPIVGTSDTKHFCIEPGGDVGTWNISGAYHQTGFSTCEGLGAGVRGTEISSSENNTVHDANGNQLMDVDSFTAARVLSSTQTDQAKAGWCWVHQTAVSLGGNVCTAIAGDPGIDSVSVGLRQLQSTGLSFSVGNNTTVDGKLFVEPGGTYTITDDNDQLQYCTLSSNNSKITTETNGKYLTIHVADDATTNDILNTSITVGGNTHYSSITYEWDIYTWTNNQNQVAAGGCRAYQDYWTINAATVLFSTSIDVSFIKTSTCPAAIGNSLYSLAGTTYGIYASETDASSNANKLATITSDANGVCTVDGKAAYTTTHTNATLYLKELTAGAGYKLNPDVISVQLGNSSQTVTLKDEPITDPLNWTLQKTDANKYNIATGLTLAGAVFEVDYYDTVSVNSVEDAQALSNPKATVQLTTATNAAGSASITVDGRALRVEGNYFDSLDMKKDLPLGTYIIREVSAPAGYTSVPSASPFVYKIFENNGKADRTLLSSNQFYATLDSENAVIYEPTQTGVIAVTKTVTSDNGLETVAPSLYDLAGTTYDLRVADGEKGAGNLYCTVTFGTDGRISNVAYAPGLTISEDNKWKAGDTAITVPYTSETSGKYYFVETHSARGFYLDEAKHDVTVTSANTKAAPAVVTLSDEPMMTSFGTFYKHIVSGTIAAANSEDVCKLFPKNKVSFMISYYNGIYETAAELPARPNAGWTVTSDGNGEFSATNTYLDDATRSYINAGLLSGVFTDKNGTAAAPQGTYVISEIRVSDAMTACGITVNTDKVIVPVRFAADIVKGSEADPANSSVAEINNTILGIVGETKSPFNNLYNPTVESNAVNAATNQTVITGITVARSPDYF